MKDNDNQNSGLPVWLSILRKIRYVVFAIIILIALVIDAIRNETE